MTRKQQPVGCAVAQVGCALIIGMLALLLLVCIVVTFGAFST